MLVYKKVDIFTPLELVRYLVNEGDLYAGKQKTRLTTDVQVQYNSPFRLINRSGGSNALNAEWDVDGEVYYKKLNWYDCIPKGKKVPCYVSDSDPTEVGTERNIHAYEQGSSHPYMSDDGDWKYATPIPADELWVPEL